MVGKEKYILIIFKCYCQNTKAPPQKNCTDTFLEFIWELSEIAEHNKINVQSQLHF